MDGERKGLPSSSSIDRYSACKGSLPLERLLRKRGELPADQDSEAASHGRLIHDLCDQAFFTEENLEKGIYRKEHLQEARAYIQEAKNCALRVWGSDETCKFYFERRLYLKHADGVPYATGKPDLVMVSGDTAIVVDYKTGWGKLPYAGQSWQLMSYAAMVQQEYEVSSVWVVFIKQGATDSEHLFSEQDLFDISTFALPGVLLKRDENPFVGGDFSPDPDTCRYCRVKLKCPALNAQYMLLEPTKGSNDLFLPSLDNAQLSAVKDRLNQLDALGKAVDQEIRSRLLIDPDGFDDWEMAAGRGRRTVADPSALCAQLIQDGAEPESIYSALKLGVADAEKLHRKATRLKGKVAKSDFDSRYGQHIEIVPGRETLKRKDNDRLN